MLLFIASVFNILGGPSTNDERVTGKKEERDREREGT